MLHARVKRFDVMGTVALFWFTFWVCMGTKHPLSRFDFFVHSFCYASKQLIIWNGWSNTTLLNNLPSKLMHFRASDDFYNTRNSPYELNKEELKRNNFKAGFEKHMTNVKWTFLLQTLRMKGFTPFLGSVILKVNNNVGHYFQTKKVLWYGNPLSPIF